MKTQASINTHVNAAINQAKEVGRNVYLACFRWFLGLVLMRLVPDFIVRLGIRYLLSLRLKEVRSVPGIFITDIISVAVFGNSVLHVPGWPAR